MLHLNDISVLEQMDYAAPPPLARQERAKPRWTLKRFIVWLKEQFSQSCCRETVRQVLKKFGFSWKKARKLLHKANPSQRHQFVAQLTQLLNEATAGQRSLVYLDEAHIRLDTDEGYGWSVSGQRFWVSSHSPGLAKVSCYGVYFYNAAQVKIYPYERANSESTVAVLKAIRHQLPQQKITVLWDNASYHRSQLVRQTAEQLKIERQALPGYSPDFMPVEHLWTWLREEVTYYACYNRPEQLINKIDWFQKFINDNPTEIADRLWTKTQLDPNEEKLRFST